MGIKQRHASIGKAYDQGALSWWSRIEKVCEVNAFPLLTVRKKDERINIGSFANGVGKSFSGISKERRGK